ncbi:MAG: DUF2125 domain-containing protein [Alkalilacustris sp.]
MSPTACPRIRPGLGLAVTAALVAAPGGALADLTAEQVWQSWQAQAGAAGQGVIAAAESREGDTLTARGVVLSGGAEDVALRAEIPEIAFTETADGSVLVRLSEAYDLVLSGPDGERLVLAVAHPGLRMVVSEGPGGLNHRLTAPELSLALTEQSGPDAPDLLALDLSATRLTASYDVTGVAGEVGATDLQVGALDLEVAYAEDDDRFDLTYALTGLSLRFAGEGLDQSGGLEAGTLGSALQDGLSLAVVMGYDTLRYVLDVVEDGAASGAAGTGMAGELRFQLDAGGLAFSTGSRNAEVTLRGPEMPAPELTLRASELTYGLRVPTVGKAEPQPVSLLVRLVEATAPEQVWAMVDPSGALPRGPVTAVIDLDADAILPGDLFGMQTMFAFMMGGPFEAVQPTRLDIKELVLRAAGAELTGRGAFTLDPTDRVTFDGLPRPQGELNLMLRGGNALLDTLVGVGLVPADQANAARMVMALFARPGEGPDELTSTIEIREGGSVFANGMRLQ